jgi:hypothetical protein
MPAPQLRAVGADEPAPTRQPLCDAISRVAAAERAVTRAQEARDRVHSAYLSALRSLDTSRDRLSAAGADNQANRVAALMGEAETGPALSDLQRAVELAEVVVAGARSDEELLDDEIRRRRQVLDFSIIARDGAVADCLRPAANALLRRIQEATATVAGLRGALRAFPLDCLQAHWDSEQSHPENPALNAKWRDVVASLSTDPDAPIPETENP